jgi:hypothetical protein
VPLTFGGVYDAHTPVVPTCAGCRAGKHPVPAARRLGDAAQDRRHPRHYLPRPAVHPPGRTPVQLQGGGHAARHVPWVQGDLGRRMGAGRRLPCVRLAGRARGLRLPIPGSTATRLSQHPWVDRRAQLRCPLCEGLRHTAADRDRRRCVQTPLQPLREAGPPSTKTRDWLKRRFVWDSHES